MPRSIKFAKQRVVVAKLALRLLHLAGSELANGSGRANVDDVVLLCAAFIGQAEGRPMTAGKIASYTGIPRSTVVRRMRDLAARGAVRIADRGAVICSLDALNRPSMVAAVEDAMRAIHRAQSDLSKMDG